MNAQGNGHEHEFEAAYGLPEALPKGETVLWQGAPDFGDLAVRVFHLKKVAVYFAILVIVRSSYLHSLDKSSLTILAGALIVAGLGLTAMVALALLAWLTARTTVYTLTDKRIVMRIGIVLT
ncbi:MAG: PH domain-containing protein, partial [Burkholderiales bacterium]